MTWKDPERLCLGCMEEMEHPGGTCPKCGFNRNIYEKDRNVHTLPSYTILAGKYLLGKVLGEGGFGITYIAWDLNRECRVAVKEYFPSGLATRDARMKDGESLTILPGEKAAFYRSGLQSFGSEGKNLLRFQHLPGIVSVRDFFQDNRTAYIVMDFVEGQTLKQYLQKYYQRYGDHKPMDETFVLEMMKPLLASLSRIHKAGIIHRDISPENIIFGPDGKVTLIDFGAARAATGTETRSLTVVLKHGYAPPEQYLSHGRQGPWTDIYAICATMYHMLTGRLPAESVDRVLGDRMPTVREINPAVSKKVSDVIQKGMALHLQERYQKVEELEELLYPEPEKQPEEQVQRLTKIQLEEQIQKTAESQPEQQAHRPAEKRPEKKEQRPREEQAKPGVPYIAYSRTEISIPSGEKRGAAEEATEKNWRRGIAVGGVLLICLIIVLFVIQIRKTYEEDSSEAYYTVGLLYGEVPLSDCLDLSRYNEENSFFLPVEELEEMKVEQINVELWSEGEGEAADMSEVEMPDFEALLSPEYAGDSNLPKPEEVIPVVSGEEYAFMDASGNLYPLSAYVENQELSESREYFGDRYLVQIVNEGEAYGAEDLYGREVLACEYSSVMFDNEPYEFGLKRTLLSAGDEGIYMSHGQSYCNSSGGVSASTDDPKEFSVGRVSENGLIPAACQGKCGYVDLSGEVCIPFQYEEAGEFSEGLAAVRLKVWWKGGSKYKWGYIDESGQIVIPPVFDEAASFSNGLAAVCLNEYETDEGPVYGYIDREGGLIAALDLEELGLDVYENNGLRVQWLNMGRATKEGTVVVGMPMEIDENLPNCYYVLDLLGTDNITYPEGIYLHDYSEAGLVMAVDYSLADWTAMDEGTYEEAPVSISYYDARGQQVGDTVMLTYIEYVNFLYLYL